MLQFFSPWTDEMSNTKTMQLALLAVCGPVSISIMFHLFLVFVVKISGPVHLLPSLPSQKHVLYHFLYFILFVLSFRLTVYLSFLYVFPLHTSTLSLVSNWRFVFSSFPGQGYFIQVVTVTLPSQPNDYPTCNSLFRPFQHGQDETLTTTEKPPSKDSLLTVLVNGEAFTLRLLAPSATFKYRNQISLR